MNSVVRWWNVVYVKMWLLRYMQQDLTGRDDETCPCVSMFRRPVATSNYVSIAVCCTSTTRRHIRWDAVCLSVCTCVCVCQSVNLWPHCFFVHKYESQLVTASCLLHPHPPQPQTHSQFQQQRRPLSNSLPCRTLSYPKTLSYRTVMYVYSTYTDASRFCPRQHHSFVMQIESAIRMRGIRFLPVT